MQSKLRSSWLIRVSHSSGACLTSAKSPPPSFPFHPQLKEHEGFRAGHSTSEGTDQHQKYHLFQELFLIQKFITLVITQAHKIFYLRNQSRQHGNGNKQQEQSKPILLPREKFVRLHPQARYSYYAGLFPFFLSLNLTHPNKNTS